MPKKRSLVSKVPERKESILRMCQLQEELLQRVLDFVAPLCDIRDTEQAAQLLFKKLDIGQAINFQEFLERKRALMKGGLLEGLTSLIHRKDLFDQITALSSSWSNRWCGWLCCPVEAVHLGIALVTAQSEVAERVSVGEFAKFFVPHQNMVIGVFKPVRAQLMELINPHTAKLVKEVLEAAPWKKGEIRVSSSPSIVKRAPDLLREHAPVRMPPPVLMVPEVPFALTDQSLSSLAHADVLGEDYIKATIAAVQTARYLLGKATTHTKFEVRKAIRRRLAPEIEELYIAVQLFSTEFPSGVTKVFDAEREGFAQQRVSTKEKK